jgi:hypothetical protein
MAAGDPGTKKRNYSATAIETTLVNSMTSAATGDTTASVSVVSVSGFPSTVPFTLILGPDTSKEEVVTVTAVAGTTLTIVRGQDNTQAQSHAAGTSVRHGVSAREFKELQTHIAARGYDADTALLNGVDSHVHGLVSGDGSVVGADQSVTLTRKTLTTPTINGATITGTVTSSTATFGSPTLTTPTVNGATLTGTVTATTATIASPTITSPTISGSPVITGLSSTGMSTSSATPKSYVDAILGSATAASTSATSAATSATSAATSATSAAASATASANSASAAATSASSALTSQTAAATSATSAATSATAAATSATSAAASATAAATSATSAAASATTAAASVAAIAAYATTASNSASAAATSASSAATSAASAAASTSAAAASASAAATSATSASASATAAATSATSAATSASSALTSQTAAATSASSALTSQTAAATSASSAATSATSAATSATSAATTYTNYDQRYLGSKSSAPTVDNLGNALITGATYWNSSLSTMYAWTGSAWSAISSANAYAAPTLGSTTLASGTTYSTVTGLTLSGGLAAADPTAALGLATKQYVDSVTAAINFHAPVQRATTAALTGTYNNGTSGVGATFTLTATGRLSIDGGNVSTNDRVLLKNQTTDLQNGIYVVTNQGGAGVSAVLTRATDYNTTEEVSNGDVVFTIAGTQNTGVTFVNTSTNPVTIGTTSITFSTYTSASLPSQTGNAGYFLTTDGTVPSWVLLPAANEILTLMGAY